MTTRPIAIVLLGLSLASTVSLLAQDNPRFKAERDRLMSVSRQGRAAANRPGEEFDTNPFEKSKVTIQTVAPGGSVSVTVPGNYPAGTVMLSERDGVTLSDAKLSATSYSGRLAIPATEFPGFARLYAFTPLSATQIQQHGYLGVTFIDAVYRLDLRSASGTVVKVTPLERTFTLDPSQRRAEVKYQAEFFKSGQTTPFETMNGTQNFESSDELSTHFDIGLTESVSSPEAAIEALMNQMNDPNLTDTQRNDLMQRLAGMQAKLFQGITPASSQASAAAEQKKNDDFGCGLIQVYAKTGTTGPVEATMVCGNNFEGGNPKFTGTMTIVK